jgi:hypothetical protein
MEELRQMINYSQKWHQLAGEKKTRMMIMMKKVKSYQIPTSKAISKE